MERFFNFQSQSKTKKKYLKRDKAIMIVLGYSTIKDSLVNGDVCDVVRDIANQYGVNYTTMRYWLKHYEAWKHDPSHSHICIDGVKSEISKYELELMQR